MSFKVILYKYLLQWIPDSIWIRIQYRRKVGVWPNLKNPKTFNEKLQWLKLHDRNPLYTKLVDKYEVKKIVAEQIGDEYIIPTLGVWDKFDDIDFDKLPNQFVLKCTHDSGGLIVVKDKSTLDVKAARKTINNCVKMNYYWSMREWPYKNVKPRIIAEKYMEDESGYELKDYKVHCFEGNPCFVQVDFDRFINHGRNIYDFNWNLQPFEIKYPSNQNHLIKKPVCLDLLQKYATILSKGYRYVRCDFYVVGDHVYFGEITFYHGSGIEKIKPHEWNEKFGSLLNLGNV